MNDEAFLQAVLLMARLAGAESPTIAHATDDTPVILDADTGRTWRIELREI